MIGKTFGVGTNPPINMPSGDWTPWLPSYEPQRFIYDTDECSQLGGFINPLETYFNWLKATGQLKQDFIDFCTKNGYFDSNGSFSFSERYTGILDGTSINGNTPANAFICFLRFGVIPRSMLNWTITDAQKYPNQALMDSDYYNPPTVTQAMIDLGKQFLGFIKQFGFGWSTGINDGLTAVPHGALQLGMQTSPLSIVVSVPKDVTTWNQTSVSYDGSVTLDHCVMLYKIVNNDSIAYPYNIMDQYQPDKKSLQSNYYIGSAIAFFIIMA